MLEIIKESFFSWLWLFGAPIKDFNILWIIIPIYVSWFFTEFFQEKKGTGFGNAITNGAVCIWVAIDWFRHITNGLTSGLIDADYTLYVKYGFAGFILIFGIIVIVKGLQRKKFAHFAGRIRVISYILIMFTPIIYQTAEIKAINIIPIFVFFPLFYFFLEIIVRIIPDSKAFEEDIGESNEKKSEPLNFDSKPSFDDKKLDFGSDNPNLFGEKNQTNNDNVDELNNIQNNLTNPNINSSTDPSMNPFANQPQPKIQQNQAPPNQQQNSVQKPEQDLYEEDPFADAPVESYDENIFDEPTFPENNPPQTERPNNETQSQNSNQQSNQEEYKEPDFNELPDNNEEIWEKIKRKNQL